MKNVVIFASGSGSNAENIINFFKNDPEIKLTAVFCNKPDALVLKRAERLEIPSVVFDRHQFYETDSVVEKLEELDTDLIVLAGFLWMIPANMLERYPDAIINIHPALLPEYGGKGMYGMRVHEAVIANKEEGSGITIHFVNEQYDEGGIIFQAMCAITPEDTPESLAEKIHALEYKFYPKVIREVAEMM